MLSRSHLHSIGTEVLSFVLAASCVGCGRPGALLCGPCQAALEPQPIERRTPRGLRVRAALPLEGVAARCVRGLKDQGMTMLARPLGAALAAVLVPAIDDGADGRFAAVPIPTRRAAFRRRGYRVPELLIRSAGAAVHRRLAPVGRAADQRGLGVRQRARNVRGTMRASAPGGTAVVLVDDVVTTGATFDEAARALEAAGARVIMAVALAAAPRHGGDLADASRTHRN